MTDLFESRGASPMLIARQEKAFDDPNSIYELKLDGIRCLAYFNEDTADLRNKRNLQLNAKFPELRGIYKNVSAKCILDGEIVAFAGHLSALATILVLVCFSDIIL